MYGTVARMRAKPGAAPKLQQHLRDFERAQVPGAVALYVYQMDADPDEYYVSVIFDSKEAYFANANSPEQNKRYQELMSLLVEEPQWHDGQITAVTLPRDRSTY